MIGRGQTMRRGRFYMCFSAPDVEIQTLIQFPQMELRRSENSVRGEFFGRRILVYYVGVLSCRGGRGLGG